MKRSHVLWSCGALAALLLAGCGAPADAPSSTADDAPDTAAQLRLIAEQKELWQLSEEDVFDFSGYAVTDLDGNGQLEVIAAGMGGTGLFTTAAFYEVNEAGDALVPCTYDFPEYHSEPDLIVDTAACYRDPDSGVTYYIFSDYFRNGAAESCEFTEALSLERNSINVRFLADRTALYDFEGTATVTCTGETGETISEAEFGSIADTTFDGFEKQEAHFEWIKNDADFAALDEDGLIEALTASREGFIIE